MKVSTIIVAVVGSICAFGGWTVAGSINVQGDAVIYVEPDEVVLRCGVQTVDTVFVKAQEMNAEAAKSMLAAVKELGIEDKHVQTSALSVTIQYRQDEKVDYVQTVASYNCTRTYAITLKDPAKFDALVDAVLSNGANQIIDFEFKTTKLREHRDEARKMAARAAKEKAALLASELNCKLGAALSVQEGREMYYGGQNFQSNNLVRTAAGSEGSETLPMGQLGVTAQVNVNFELIPLVSAE